MIAVEDTMLVLLAAGRSERFGDVGSKLDQDFLGRPLGLHVAVALEDVPFAGRIAVTGRAALDYAAHGFAIIRNEESDAGLASSVKLGVAYAQARGADAVLIALADMPRVTTAHVMRLFDATTHTNSVVASSDGLAPKPPALFGAGRFDLLLSLDGDAGARDMVRSGRHVVTTPAELIDVDTVADLNALRELVHSPAAITWATARRTPMLGDEI